MKNQAKRIDIVKIKMVKEGSILYPIRKIQKPSDADALIRPFLEDRDRETFVVICVDVKMQPTSIHIASMGILNSTLVHPREIFKTAILSNASSIILGHNHPSGDPTPSKDDIDITKRLHDAGEILGIDVVDHIIIGNEENRFTSFKEKGFL